MGAEDNYIDDLQNRYRDKLEKQLGVPTQTQQSGIAAPIVSREYSQFKEEAMSKQLGFYEKACNWAEKTIKIKPDEKKAAEIKESIDIVHLNITPTGVTSLSIIAPLAVFVFGSFISFLFLQSFFFVFFFLVLGIAIMKPMANMPLSMANAWRLKASNQMVLSIFYVVTYMRHTSNLENAVNFAAEHLAPPLSLDLKKVVWNMQTGKFDSVKESLDAYLETWRKWNLEFIESFHLIEGSLYEGDEDRRVSVLDKSLQVILEETYEKMMHYATDLKSPMTMLHMLGIILPILGLVILPLIVSFMEGAKWYHIAMIYNVGLPIGVFYFGKTILSKRPTGYGDTDISLDHPELKKYKNIIIKLGGSEISIQPIWFAASVGAILFLIGMSPIIMHMLNPEYDYGFGGIEESSSCGRTFCMIEYKCPNNVQGCSSDNMIGPFGLGASLLSLLVTLAFGLGFGLYYKLRSKNVIKIRERAKELENEFASGLFQLGNRLGDNIPAEIAFGKVADMMQDTASGQFFKMVSSNITRLGMGVEQAIFDPKSGALAYFPSNLIESSMKVLVESVKKGPTVAAQALLNISKYVKEIHRVNERLKDLMADIISSMKSQTSFLTPVIAGIVVGITSMVTTILGKLGSQMTQMTRDTGQVGGFGSLFGTGIPTFHFQIIVGLYVVQIVYVLTILTNGIENGSDKLNERYLQGVNLVKSTLLYVIISAVVIVIFNSIAGQILTSTLS
jgi:hypothetical protein